MLKPETHYPDAMKYDTTLYDEIRSGIAILNESYNTSLMWHDAMQCNVTKIRECQIFIE